jgi:hypothetical protein
MERRSKVATPNYGSGRVVSVREGPNVRQSFDGAKIRSEAGTWHIDAFAVRPDLDKPGFFDNTPDHSTAFWGIYATRPWRRRVSLDTYYLGLDRKQATFERGTAGELRHTTGARLWRPVSTNERAWDFDYEGIAQFGTFGSGNIRAWSVASDTGYSLPKLPLRPRFSVKADASSGDNPLSRTLGTFNPIYPIGNYFGVLADTGPGPVNFIDVHPRVQTSLPHRVSVSTDFVAQWRENLNDGVYAVPGFLLVPAGTSRARFVGYRPGVEARWEIDRHAYFQADYGIFYAGQFLRKPRLGATLTTRNFGLDTNSEGERYGTPFNLRGSGGGAAGIVGSPKMCRTLLRVDLRDAIISAQPIKLFRRTGRYVWSAVHIGDSPRTLNVIGVCLRKVTILFETEKSHHRRRVRRRPICGRPPATCRMED